MGMYRMPQQTNSRVASRGFTVLEVLVAMVVLAIGLVAMASLMAGMVSGTTGSKYMSLASTLASEKLEDLNRWPAADPHVAVSSGTTAGSLTADVVQNVTVGTTTTSVNYFDEVLMSATGGAVTETVSGLDAAGNAVYTTTTHQPDGTVVTTTSSTAPATAGTVRFKRRWIIEKDAPVTGVRRITMRVILSSQLIEPGVTFQMSMVRP